jgi:hypothetical protein
MKQITLKPNGTLEHLWLEGIHSNIPNATIDVSDANYLLLSQNTSSKQYDQISGSVIDYVPTFDLPAAKALKSNQIAVNELSTIEGGFASSALGSPHIYPSDKEDQANLVGVLAAGTDRPFVCSADSGVTFDFQLHTHAQLTTVVNNGIDHKMAQIIKRQTQLAQVEAATTQDELDAIVW